MIKYKISMRKIYSGIFTFFLIWTSTTLAQGNNIVWLQFEKASKLFQDGAQSKQVVELLHDVQRNTQDPLLFSRAGLLLSAAHQREEQYEKAILELQKLIDSSQPIPQSVLEETWLRIGQLYLEQQRFQLAISAFNKIINRDSNPFIAQEAQLALAWIAAEQNDWNTSDSLISSLTFNKTSHLTDERILILKARGVISRGNPDEAIILLQNTRSKACLYLLAIAHELAGNRIMAVSIYKKLHDLYPNTVEGHQALFQAGEVFMRAGDWLASKSEFKRLLPLVTDDLMTDAIHFRLGWIYLNLDEFEKALDEFRYVPTAENNSYFRYMEAECLRRQGIQEPEKLNQAIMLFHNIASVNLQSPLAPLAKLKAALTEIQKGDSTGALVSLRQFLNLYPKDELVPAVYFLLGANESENASQRYFDQIVQQNRNSDVFDVAYFAMQNQDFRKGRYQRVITRNVSLPQLENGEDLNDWQRANHLLLAESAYFLKHYHQALQAFRRVSANMTDDLSQKANLGIAWCKLQTVGPDSALLMFEEIRRNVKGVNRVLADYGYATVQFLRQDYEKALTGYPVEVSHQKHPELQQVVLKSLFRSAQCYFRLQYYMQAIETWDKLAREFPENELAMESLFNIADVYFRANHFSQADSVYQVLMKRYPDHSLASESALKQAQSAYNAGEYELAITRYQLFIENYPQHPKNKDALEGIQLSYFQIGQIDQASETLKKVIEQTTNSDLAVDARFRIAVNYFEEQKYRQAIEAFKEILTLYPNSSYAIDAQFSLCKCYIAQENYRSATEELLRFTQYFPQSAQLAEAYFLLGVGYYQLESNLSAVDYFEKVIQEFPDSEYFGPAMKNAGWCYDRLKDSEKAVQIFSRYLENFPTAKDNHHIQLQVARLLLESGNSQSALSKFQALQKVPDPEISAEASYLLGMHYISKDQLKKAESVFQTVANGNGGDNYFRLSAMAQLAAIYENRGESNKAITTYKLLASSTTEERWTTAANERINALMQQINSHTE